MRHEPSWLPTLLPKSPFGAYTSADHLAPQHPSRAIASIRHAHQSRLPKESTGHFAPLLRALQDDPVRYGCTSYGLSVTTLEEVFLAVTAKAMEAHDKAEEQLVDGHTDASLPKAPWSASRAAAAPLRPLPPERRLQGLRLGATQWWALVAKRALSARRDKLAVLTQLLVPLMLVGIALWSGKATQVSPR